MDAPDKWIPFSAELFHCLISNSAAIALYRYPKKEEGSKVIETCAKTQTKLIICR
jgi:hypothetical protein